jgi:hypothetical protein
MTTRRVSVAAAKKDLSRLLKESRKADILIFNERAGALAGALVSGEAYREVLRLKAYLEALRISDKTRMRGPQVLRLLRKSRCYCTARTDGGRNSRTPPM